MRLDGRAERRLSAQVAIAEGEDLVRRTGQGAAPPVFDGASGLGGSGIGRRCRFPNQGRLRGLALVRVWKGERRKLLRCRGGGARRGRSGRTRLGIGRLAQPAAAVLQTLRWGGSRRLPYSGATAREALLRFPPARASTSNTPRCRRGAASGRQRARGPFVAARGAGRLAVTSR